MHDKYSEWIDVNEDKSAPIKSEIKGKSQTIAEGASKIKNAELRRGEDLKTSKQ